MARKPVLLRAASLKELDARLPRPVGRFVQRAGGMLPLPPLISKRRNCLMSNWSGLKGAGSPPCHNDARGGPSLYSVTERSAICRGGGENIGVPFWFGPPKVQMRKKPPRYGRLQGRNANAVKAHGVGRASLESTAPETAMDFPASKPRPRACLPSRNTRHGEQAVLAAIPPVHTNTADSHDHADCEYYQSPRTLTRNGYQRHSKDCATSQPKNIH